LSSPTDLVESGKLLMGNTQFDKRLDRLMSTLQCRSIDLIKRYMPVFLEKSGSLPPAHLVEIGINTAALNNVFKVEISLAVAYEVNFFADQFCTILAQQARPAKIDKLSGRAHL